MSWGDYAAGHLQANVGKNLYKKVLMFQLTCTGTYLYLALDDLCESIV